MKDFAANTISAILHPILLPLYGALLYYFYDSATLTPQLLRLITVSIIAVFMVVLPMLWFLLLGKTGTISSFSATERKDRNWLYSFTLICYIVTAGGLMLLDRIGLPTDSGMILAVCGAGASLATAAVINLFWKISAHATGIAALTGAAMFVTQSNGDNLTWIYCLLLVCSGLVLCARLQLKAHTGAQLVAGYINGFAWCFVAPALYCGMQMSL